MLVLLRFALCAVLGCAARRLELAAVHLYTNERMIDNLSIYPRLGYVEVERRLEDGFKRVFFEKRLD